MKKRSDGRWQKKITLPNGKIKVLYSSANTERQAVKDFNDQLLNLEMQQKKASLFSSVADSWNCDYRSRISEINYRKATKSTYEKILSQFGTNYVNEITPNDIHNYITSLVNQKYSQKTIATNKSVLNMIFNFAIINGFIETNPCNFINLPYNLPKQQRKIPSDTELEIVNSHYDGFDFLPYFLLNTGLRKSEALALDFSDIDFKSKLIKVNKHLVYDGNRPVIENKTKTASGTRSVILLDRVAEKLPKNKKGPVFSNANGTHLTSKQYTLYWKNWQQKYNLTVTAHQLRHGFATMLYEAGIDLKDAQDLMGHSDIKTTHTIYTHIRDKRKEATANKLNNFSF